MAYPHHQLCRYAASCHVRFESVDEEALSAPFYALSREW